MTYGTITKARGLTAGDRAVFVPTGETVRVLRIEPRDFGRTVRPVFQLMDADGLTWWASGWKLEPERKG